MTPKQKESSDSNLRTVVEQLFEDGYLDDNSDIGTFKDSTKEETLDVMFKATCAWFPDIAIDSIAAFFAHRLLVLSFIEDQESREKYANGVFKELRDCLDDLKPMIQTGARANTSREIAQVGISARRNGRNNAIREHSNWRRAADPNRKLKDIYEDIRNRFGIRLTDRTLRTILKTNK